MDNKKIDLNESQDKNKDVITIEVTGTEEERQKFRKLLHEFCLKQLRRL